VFGRYLKAGSLAGIPIRLDLGWFLLFTWILWTLPRNYLLPALPGWPIAALWVLAGVTALVFLGVILVHELAHSLIARAMKLRVNQITLTMLGGSVKLAQERESPWQELSIALAGPISTILIGVLFGLVDMLASPAWMSIAAPARFLRTVCIVLGLFNLLPALPLDGGQALRAVLWSLSGDPQGATHWAARMGQLVGSAVTIGGLLLMLSRESPEGAWIAVAGLLVDSGARAAQRRASVQLALSGQVAADVMLRGCVPLSPELTLDMLEDELAAHEVPCLAVGDERGVAGLITQRRLKRVPKGRRATTSLAQVQVALSDANRVPPELPLDHVLERMTEHDLRQIPVMRDDTLLGVINRDDVIDLIEKRMALGLR
jgi:Zn-dependent protease/CBS domain-containing protein